LAREVRPIEKDHATCARNFEHMVQFFIKYVLKSTAMPWGGREGERDKADY